MKRILSWLLSALVLVSCCAMTVSADNIYNDAVLDWSENTDGVIFGDINTDGKINIRDLGLLQSYLNKWDVTLDLQAADVNVDGNVNVRDLAILQRYLNNWEVELGPSEPVDPPVEPEVEMPAAGYDVDGKGRIVVRSSDLTDGVATFVFENVSKQSGREWIIPEYSRITYACYDAQGNTLTTGIVTIGALEVDEIISCHITVPAGTVRIAFVNHNLEYWTPWT